MVVDPFQFATEGVGPGFSTYSFATLGFGFEIEITVRPKPNGGGSGGVPTLWDDAVPYEITIRISYKGKKWEEKRLISPLMMKSLEKVMASFRRISVPAIEVFGQLNSLIKKSISIFAKRK
jgi:hypothetical protein